VALDITFETNLYRTPVPVCWLYSAEMGEDVGLQFQTRTRTNSKEEREERQIDE